MAKTSCYSRSSFVLITAQVSAIWLILGLVLRYVSPGLVDFVNQIFSYISLPGYPTLFVTLLMVLLTSGMLRGHRAALIFYLGVIQLPSVIVAILELTLFFDEFQLLPATVQLGTISNLFFASLYIVVGIWSIGEFPRRVRGRWVFSVAILMGGLALSAIVVWIMLSMMHFETSDNLLTTAVNTAMGLSPEDPAENVRFWVPASVRIVAGIISAASLFIALIVLLKSEKVPSVSAAEHIMIRRLLLDPPSQDSLGYFATRYDRNIVVSPDQRAAVTYRVVNGVCLAAGDPIGDPHSWGGAISAWRDYARKNSWVIAAVSASDAGARAYKSASLYPVPLGDETIIDVADFHLKDLPEVRRALSGPRRAGYTVKVRRQSSISAEELTTLSLCADSWRVGEERGFTMASERVGDPRDFRSVIVTAHDAQGQPVGLLTFAPWGLHGLSLDVMRRSPDAISGVTELMVATLAQEAPNFGVEHISLNFVVMRETIERGAKVGASPRQRFALKFLMFTSRWWQIYSLYRSNVKYRPRWQTRYLCIDNAFFSARTLVAYAAAEGFLPQISRYFPPVGDPEEIIALEKSLIHKPAPEPHIPEQRRVRRQKLADLEQRGIVGYPVGVPRTHSIAEIIDSETAPDADISITGRVHHIRDFGGVVFADLVEEHRKIQILFERTAGQPWREFRSSVNRGDLISVTGKLGASRTGTPSFLATQWMMAAKSLVPMPQVALTHPHLRAKFRHIDYALNARAYELFTMRAKIVASVRQALYRDGYLEAETPILQTIHGGANARPFRTHINAYDQSLTLRIAPELYLKRLIVGGVPKVFEIGRNFRNEGVDNTHNPEFTSLEAYAAYGDWNTMRELTEELIRTAAVVVNGKPEVVADDGSILDLNQPWPVIPVFDAVSKAVGREIVPGADIGDYSDLVQEYDIEAESVGQLVTELYDQLIEPNTVFPTFYTGFPVETSPLTMADPDNPHIAQRWDLVGLGMELGTAYTELAHPLEQRKRFTAQSLLAAGGDPEAMEIDEPFLAALEFGMPPTGGLGIGIDRMVMFLTGTTIREVLAFPFVKPEK
ncbi:bifunctional lysylphosphatidylglycerol synthetase/lysine--tRNA ligase LysX [Arcanobacterium pinnipediorum]|uniref:Lysine--tRNA ligase n=1 Tax=Arcanobacterium pinnipediorum TaxID=1503041 RepID=A0ABY5AFJ4_9ACTO|nr:bifunctional lysylphosphatidylglycerol synthetase/lysine--tRNA ligase LysX [Arcanobacterium pinnipediorum]USR78775.1 bifunctional lysylphosphatidylglycerol synthetase/lysine--tRNA ligase LysX [Arcanobacterium pinnipediorum]